MWVRTHIFLVSLVLLCGQVIAQVSAEKVASIPPAVADPPPFKIGETLVYKVAYSKLFFSGVIGELRMTVSKPQDPAQSELIELKAEATSKGFFPALFGVKVKDRYISLINSTDFGVHVTTKHLDQGKLRREQKSVVNRKLGHITYTDRDLTNSKSVPKVKEKPSPTWIQDLLSVIYFVRTQPLKDGDVIEIPISDAGEVYTIQVITDKREEIKSAGTKVKTIVLNAKVFDGRYIRRSGEMLVWVTDDSTRTPLRAKVKTSGSTFTVELKRPSQS